MLSRNLADKKKWKMNVNSAHAQQKSSIKKQKKKTGIAYENMRIVFKARGGKLFTVFAEATRTLHINKQILSGCL